MSFNDLERGTGGAGNGARGSPSRAGGAGSGGLTGSMGRAGGASRHSGPLPLYRAPPSSAAPSNSTHAAIDVEVGAAAASSAPSEAELEFERLSKRMGIQIFKLNSNVAGIEKLVELSGKSSGTGAGKDRDWTKSVADLTSTTQSLSSSLLSDMKQLGALRCSGQAQKIALSKLRSDLEAALKGFKQAQVRGAEAGRKAVEGERRKQEGNRKALETTPLINVADPSAAPDSSAASQEEQGEQQVQAQAQAVAQEGPSQAEVEFQEALISEREAEIREIESGIHELNEIFRDLGTIVQEQGGMIDNIEYNVQTIATHTGAADRELVSAHEYQRKAGKRAACLLAVVGFVVAIVLIAALS